MSSKHMQRNKASRLEASSQDSPPLPHRLRPNREVVIQQTSEGNDQPREPAHEPAESRSAPPPEYIGQQKKYSSTYTATHTVTMTRAKAAGNYEAPGHQLPPGASTPQDQARPRANNNSTDNHTTSGSSSCQGHSTFERIICGGSGFQWNGNAGNHHATFKDIKAGDNGVQFSGVQWNGGFGGLSKNDVEGLQVVVGILTTAVSSTDKNNK